MLFEKDQMERHQHRKTFESSHLHRIQNSKNIFVEREKRNVLSNSHVFVELLVSFLRDVVELNFLKKCLSSWDFIWQNWIWFTSDQFEENFVRKSELIFHAKCRFYKLDMWDFVHVFPSIDEYMANRKDDHIKKERRHAPFPNKSFCFSKRKSKWKNFFFFKDQLTLHSNPDSFSLWDEDFFSSLLFPDDEDEGKFVSLSAEGVSVDAIINMWRKKINEDLRQENRIHWEEIFLR